MQLCILPAPFLFSDFTLYLCESNISKSQKKLWKVLLTFKMPMKKAYSSKTFKKFKNGTSKVKFKATRKSKLLEHHQIQKICSSYMYEVACFSSHKSWFNFIYIVSVRISTFSSCTSINQHLKLPTLHRDH